MHYSLIFNQKNIPSKNPEGTEVYTLFPIHLSILLLLTDFL